MEDFDLLTSLGADSMNAVQAGEVLLRLSVAAGLGALIAYRPWRLLSKRLSPNMQTAQAQTMIAVAGALMVAVIQDNLARAFGLVGLGAFIRFRSGIKDPRDAAVMFVMIGIGMACGLGTVPIAIVAAVFVGVILAIFDLAGNERQWVRVRITMKRADKAFDAIRSVYPDGRVIEAPGKESDKSRVVLEVAATDGVDAATILRKLQDKGVSDIGHVTLEDE